MTQKLEFLDRLKNNMGEEMAEMMSEEITKVMDKQRQIEEEYASLVHQRDQLKGITNKHRLEETKKDIQVCSIACLTDLQLRFLSKDHQLTHFKEKRFTFWFKSCFAIANVSLICECSESC